MVFPGIRTLNRPSCGTRFSAMSSSAITLTREMIELWNCFPIGLIAGWLAGQFVKGGGYGLVGDLIVGVVGALIGGFLFRVLGLSAYGLIGNLVVATVGAVVLLIIIRAIKRAK